MWRATNTEFTELPFNAISIHALRVEGDGKLGDRIQGFFISIHALRVEGDSGTVNEVDQAKHFNPRPPCGGRLVSLS